MPAKVALVTEAAEARRRRHRAAAFDLSRRLEQPLLQPIGVRSDARMLRKNAAQVGRGTAEPASELGQRRRLRPELAERAPRPGDERRLGAHDDRSPERREPSKQPLDPSPLRVERFTRPDRAHQPVRFGGESRTQRHHRRKPDRRRRRVLSNQALVEGEHGGAVPRWLEIALDPARLDQQQRTRPELVLLATTPNPSLARGEHYEREPVVHPRAGRTVLTELGALQAGQARAVVTRGRARLHFPSPDREGHRRAVRSHGPSVSQTRTQLTRGYLVPKARPDRTMARAGPTSKTSGAA